MREQLVLAAAGVLKLVDEQMANAVGNGHRGIGWESVFAFQHIQRNLRNLDVIHGRSLCKHHLQLARSAAQQLKTRAHNLPIFVRIACWRKLANGGERCFKPGTAARLAIKLRNRAFSALHSLGNP